MHEVSGRAVRTIVEVLQEASIPVDPHIARIADARRIDWDTFITFVDGLEKLPGNSLSLEEIGTRMLRVPSFQFLQLAAKLVISPNQLYAVAHQMFAPAMFTNVSVTQEWLPTGRLVVTGEIQAGFRASEAFHRMCHANVAALPKLLDLPPSQIEEQMLGARRARLIIVPPPSHTIVSKLRRGARAFLALGEAVRGVVRQQSEIEEGVAALRSSRHELRQLLERLPEGVLIHRGGIVAWANASMLESLGHATLDAIVGRSLLDFLPVEDRATVAKAMANAQPNEVTDTRTTYRIVRPDGSSRTLEAGTVQQVEFEGVMSRLVVLRDVTDQHRLRDQLAMSERMALLGRLVAGIAHEINNPLAYAHTSIEVAQRETKSLRDPLRTAKVDEALVRAREGTERVRGIVRDMHVFSRADDEAPEAVDLQAALDSTLAIAANAIAPRARVVRNYGRVPYARASRGRLGQLFLNLVLNAADAITEGRPEQNEIRITLSTDVIGRAVIEISDTGVGIAPGHHAQVFEPFFTTKGVGAGTGLGLSICHGIVTQLGGEISFESSPGLGTTFRVVLPASDEAPVIEPPVVLDRGRSRLLIIDDEPDLLRSIEALLGDDHDVVTAPSGREALELLRSDRGFDVILTDLMMADVTGMDLFEAVRTDYPGLEQQVVFMTGGAFTSRSRSLLASVPNRCLEKPFDAEELVRVVSELVGKRSAN